MLDIAEAILGRPHLPLGVGLILASIFVLAWCLRPMRPAAAAARSSSAAGARPRAAAEPAAGSRSVEARPSRSERRLASGKARGAEGRRLADAQGRMDLTATKDGLELTLELPGLVENDLQLDVADGVLTISGEVRAAPDWKNGPARSADRTCGAFSRSIQLPAGVRTDRIKAFLHQGLLKVTIPRPSLPEPGRIFVHGGPMRLDWTADAMEVTVDLPGVKQEDIQVVVSHDVLTVSRAMKAANDAGREPTLPGDPGQGGFSRSFKLPWGVNADQISAIVRMGVLKVTIPVPAKYDFKKIDVRPAA